MSHLRRYRAYTLVEIPVTAAIAFLALFGLIAGAYQSLETYRYSDDVGASLQRAERVYAIIRQPLDHCGYGLPKDPSAYRERFGVGGPPFSWEGPLSVSFAMVDGERREDASCMIAYAIPSGIYNKREVSASEDILDVTLASNPHLLEAPYTYSPPRLPKNWALFGSMLPDCYPLQASGPGRTSGTEVQLSFKWVRPAGDEEIVIPENDELFYLRAMECRVGMSATDDYAFFTNDQSGSGRQPRVLGVVDARFEWDATRNLLRVVLLTRGNRRYTKIKTAGIPKGWPEIYAADIPDEMRHYRLFAYEATFGLKNF